MIFDYSHFFIGVGTMATFYQGLMYSHEDYYGSGNEISCEEYNNELKEITNGYIAVSAALEEYSTLKSYASFTPTDTTAKKSVAIAIESLYRRNHIPYHLGLEDDGEKKGVITRIIEWIREKLKWIKDKIVGLFSKKSTIEQAAGPKGDALVKETKEVVEEIKKIENTEDIKKLSQELNEKTKEMIIVKKNVYVEIPNGIDKTTDLNYSFSSLKKINDFYEISKALTAYLTNLIEYAKSIEEFNKSFDPTKYNNIKELYEAMSKSSISKAIDNIANIKISLNKTSIFVTGNDGTLNSFLFNIAKLTETIEEEDIEKYNVLVTATGVQFVNLEKNIDIFDKDRKEFANKEEEIKKIVNGSLKAYEDKATSSSLFKDKELTEEQTKILTSYVTFMNSAHMGITQGLFLINESFNGIIYTFNFTVNVVKSSSVLMKISKDYYLSKASKEKEKLINGDKDSNTDKKT